MPDFEYSTFISYSHKDKPWAKWLKRRLENQFLPINPSHRKFARIYDGAVPDFEGLPCRHPEHALRDVFRDDQNVGCGPLSEVLKRNIAKSKFLIVLCSPASRRSSYVADEIRYFKQTHPESYRERIIPLILHGRIDGLQGINECFPEGLDPSILGARAVDLDRPGWRYKYKAVGWFDRMTGFSARTARKEQALCKIIGTILRIDPDNMYKTRRRIMLRRRRFAGLMLLLALASCIGHYFSYKHTFTRCYTNYVERNGAPEGIHRLHPWELSGQLLYYEFRVRGGLVREIRCRDASGNLTEPQQPGLWNTAPWLVYEYDSAGLVSRIRCRDGEGPETFVQFKGTDRDRIELTTPRGESSYLHNDSKETSTRLHQIRTRRNLRGEIVRMKFYTNTDSGSPGKTAEGIGEEVFERDPSGLIRSVTFRDVYGIVTSQGKGIASEHFVYDRLERLVEQAFFSEAGTPVCNGDFVHAIRFSGLGTDSITETCLGTDGNPCLNRDCHAHVSVVTRANSVAVYYFDRQGRPTTDKSLTAGHRTVRNPKTGSETVCHFDPAGNPTYCRDGYAIAVTLKNGTTTVTGHFNPEMEYCPAFGALKAPIERISRLGRHGIRRETFIAPGERCLGSWGSSVLEQTFDEKQRLIRYACLEEADTQAPERGIGYREYTYDDFGNPCEERRYISGLQIARIRYRYDAQGNLLREQVFDASDRPTFIPTERTAIGKYDLFPAAYHEIRRQYDKYGRMLSETYYGMGDRVFHRNGYVYDRYGNIVEIDVRPGSGAEIRYRFRYDSLGRFPTEVATFDRNDHLKAFDGIARTEYRYDGRGNLIWTKHYDERNHPAIDRRSDMLPGYDCKSQIRNFCAAYSFFDDRDNCIETRFFDDRIQPYATGTHGSVVKYRFDENDRQVEAANFHLGKPYTTCNFHREQLLYEGFRPVVLRYLDANDKPMNNSKGFAEIRFKGERVFYYNTAGQPIASASFRDPLNRTGLLGYEEGGSPRGEHSPVRSCATGCNTN